MEGGGGEARMVMVAAQGAADTTAKPHLCRALPRAIRLVVAIAMAPCLRATAGVVLAIRDVPVLHAMVLVVA